MLYLILAQLFAQRRDPAGETVGERSPADAWAAFAGAALFAVHPLATESVNYISSQSVPWAVFFLLLGFYFFLTVYACGPTSKSQSGRDAGARRWRLGASYAAFVLALLSKPIAIVLPQLLLLWQLTLGGRDEAFWRSLPRRSLKHLPYAAVTALYLIIRLIIMPAGSGGGGGPSLAERFAHYLTQTKAMVFYYLGHAVWPVGLNADRAYPKSASLFEPRVLAAIAVIAIIAALLVRFRRHGVVVFLTLWFPSCLLLTSYVVMLGQTVNEHRVYLSLAGFCGVAGFLLVRLATVFPVSIFDFSIGRRSGRALVASVALVFAVGLGIETRHRNTVWSSHLNLWQDAALNGGTWRAHMNYGLALEGAGRKDEALAQFEEAVRLGPYAFAHLNLGHARVKRGDVARGITHLRTAVRLWPSAPEPHLYLALGLDRQGKAAEAEREYQRAIAIRPRYLKAYRYLARFLERRGRLAEALAELQRLRAIDPSAAALEKQIDRLGQRLSALRTPNGGDLFREAFALQKNNYRGRAIERYEQLLALNPDHRQGAFNLAYAYLQGDGSEDWQRSAKLFHKVLKIDPSYVEAIYHLASAYWKIGDREQARKYDKAYLARGQHVGLRRSSRERLGKLAAP